LAISIFPPVSGSQDTGHNEHPLSEQVLHTSNPCLSLVTADQQNRPTALVKSKEHPIPDTGFPNAVSEVLSCSDDETSERDRRAGEEGQDRSSDHFGVNGQLFSLGQPVPPVRELVCKFNLPFPWVECSFRGYGWSKGDMATMAVPRPAGLAT
jgi:hypothetical protein